MIKLHVLTRSSATVALIGLTALSRAAIAQAPSARNADCGLAQAGAAQTAARLRIADSARPLCQLVIQPTGVELRTSDTSSAYGFGSSIVRDANGRYFTAWGERISVWNARGELTRTFGRAGSSPGELSRGLKQLFTSSAPQVMVRDGRRIHTFTDDGKSLSSSVLPEIVFDWASFRRLSDGRFLGAGLVDSRGAESFFVLQLEPALSVTSFGTLNAAELAHPDGGSRAVGYASGDTFWAGPPFMSGAGGYELQQWSTAGSLLRTIKREASWFPAASASGPASRTQRPPPFVSQIHVDARGLLVVYVSVPNRNWSPTASPETFLDLYVDVIDPQRGTLVATLGPLNYGAALQQLPMGLFPGTNDGYVIGESADELPVAKMVRIDLVRAK